MYFLRMYFTFKIINTPFRINCKFKFRDQKGKALKTYRKKFKKKTDPDDDPYSVICCGRIFEDSRSTEQAEIKSHITTNTYF